MTLTHAHPALAPHGAGRFAARPAPRHLLGLEAMDRADLLRILDEAERWREAIDAREPDSRELAGITVCLGFFEASTRTRVSFELAATRLGARVVTFSVGESSTAKGETLLDTVRVLEAMRVDLFVMRHPASGAPGYIAEHLQAGVINAGDGQHEHPTQGLLASTGEYAREWGIDARRVRLLHEDGVVLHPGPVNRGVELSPDVVDGERSVIFDQVTNGVAVRCAVLARCARALSEAA